jgi:hypothetical protein
MCSDRPAGAPSEACLHKCGDLYCEDGIYHFGPEAIRKGQLTWQLESESGEIAASGKLFVLVVDPVKDIEKRPAMQQLLTSVRNYVASDRFAPTVTLQLYELDALFDYNKIQETETRSDEVIKSINRIFAGDKERIISI